MIFLIFNLKIKIIKNFSNIIETSEKMKTDMTILNEKLAIIKSNKEAIKNALIDKGLDMEDVAFSDYAKMILALPNMSERQMVFDEDKEYKSFLEADELNYISCRGALLWKKDGVKEGRPGFLLVNNGDKFASDYWDPDSIETSIPAKDGYTLIGVCLGTGYWIKIGYSGLNTKMLWCLSDDICYQFLEGACRHAGYEITKYMRQASGYSDNSIWALRDADELSKHIYIPNQGEMLQICHLACDSGNPIGVYKFDRNLGKLIGLMPYRYWTSGQCPSGNNYNSAFIVYSYSGTAACRNKSNYSYYSCALIHFGA